MSQLIIFVFLKLHVANTVFSDKYVNRVSMWVSNLSCLILIRFLLGYTFVTSQESITSSPTKSTLVHYTALKEPFDNLGNNGFLAVSHSFNAKLNQLSLASYVMDKC